MKKFTALLLALLCLAALAACTAQQTPPEQPSSTTAIDYGEPQIVGEGATQFVFRVTAENEKFQYLVQTDAETVGDALLEVELVAGTVSAGSLMVTTVCGTTLDYQKDSAYWAFHINGAYAETGVSQTKITPDAVYEFVYTKA